jgi:ribosome recycling factor
MISGLLADMEDRIGKSVQSISRDMAVVRTGKASPALLEHVRVECWGDSLPLKQVAGISAPEPRLLVVQPWDQSTAEAIVKAIESSDLGLRASTDGHVIRIPVPKLSEDRRRELIRHVRKLAEDGRTAVRNIRRDCNDHLHRARKQSEITEDQESRTLDEVQKAVDEAISEIDRILKAKETEIMEV